MIGRDHKRIGTAGQFIDRRLRADRHRFGDMGSNQFGDLIRLLTGNQTTGNFGVRPARDDGLDAFPLESAPDAVHLEGGPNPCPFVGRKAGFAE